MEAYVVSSALMGVPTRNNFCVRPDNDTTALQSGAEMKLLYLASWTSHGFESLRALQVCCAEIHADCVGAGEVGLA
jgi:hypothetical protein